MLLEKTRKSVDCELKKLVSMTNTIRVVALASNPTKQIVAQEIQLVHPTTIAA